MSIRHYAFAASIAAILAGNVAAAQPQPAPSTTAQPTPTDQTAPATAAPVESTAPVTAPSATAAGTRASVSVDATGARVTVVSNPPVPDTPENRAKYGGPMSDGGRKTAPRGN
jgi:hypothetical protein